MHLCLSHRWNMPPINHSKLCRHQTKVPQQTYNPGGKGVGVTTRGRLASFNKDFSHSLILPDTLSRNGLWGSNALRRNHWWNRKYAAEFLMTFCCERHKWHSVHYTEPREDPNCTSKQQTTLGPYFWMDKQPFLLQIHDYRWHPSQTCEDAGTINEFKLFRD